MPFTYGAVRAELARDYSLMSVEGKKKKEEWKTLANEELGSLSPPMTASFLICWSVRSHGGVRLWGCVPAGAVFPSEL